MTTVTTKSPVQKYGTNVANTYHTLAFAAETVALDAAGPTKVKFQTEDHGEVLWAEVTPVSFDLRTGMYLLEIEVLDAPSHGDLILVYGRKGWVSSRNLATFTSRLVLHHLSGTLSSQGLKLLFQPDSWQPELPDMGDAFKRR